MTRRRGPANLLVAALLVNLMYCKPGPEKSGGITPSTQDTAQERPTGLGGPPGGWYSSREATARR